MSNGAGMQLSRERLLEAYRTMRTIRDFEERVHEEFEAGNLPGFVHLYAGEEASAVGVCSHLDDEDRICSTHRGHGHCIAKGCDVEGMWKELWGSSEGLCAGKGGSMHIADLSKGMMGANAIVGGGPPLALGAAMAAKTLQTGKVAVTFTGDGGSNQGTTFESLNFASVFKLPVLFVFENNGYAEATSSSWSVACGDIVNRASAFGMPGVQVDGYDFFAVHDAVGDAVERARNGEGPTLIEVKLGRFYGHHEGDNQSYRGRGEVDALRRDHDCLQVFRKRVTEASLLDDGDLDAIDRETAALMDRCVEAARDAPRPTVDQLTTDVYISY
ncbi:MAG: thiamine pyrophosphate-dependent dehydrogenase E1 component subunit alpha [Alphaproteobacteria bacterium]|nr:thiamine pyrophosphate-dependent dehydrogenase E1 component subunit alpha [Rhodospirillaceae bacterium]MBT6511862.1 thiamine pyrophosphate-dependent dehydrogenase E1 component subunit alpha [Rhodospirillaceae bacterium]MBT7615473.1 thiamine pyrophosphate-dependent dehydrogenase E1 component subunit alpha [Rhodospirillaceae bacterium]MBT7648526.1 thiamine pyrophosphate-dependent dehydrogenase E1 component subunit alpha [Rhodospirillaceae bacterium]MDG2481833.1 thiamine pyrophosphate-dependent